MAHAADAVLQVVPADRSLVAKSARLNPPKGSLPDGEITQFAPHVRAAYLIRATRRYGHAILGDAIEAGGFRVVRPGGGVAEFVLGADSVFEDLRVRLADVTGDGRPEALLVRSYLDRGAALVVFRIGAKRITHLAETPPIGLAHRWLNPVGVADFDGDGQAEIALVVTPHIGGTLKLYRLKDRNLVEIASRHGFSNHRIGSRVLDLSAVLDFNGDGVADIAVPDASRRRLMVVTFAGGRYRVLGGTKSGSEIVTALRLVDANGDGRRDLVYGLAGGRVVAVLRPAS